jgi:hypothetical protein
LVYKAESSYLVCHPAYHRFVEENEQDHALLKLESQSYHMGSWDVFKYTDDFEDLVDLAGFEDPLMKVTKYRTGLDPAINLAITGSSDPLDLWNYAAWHLHAYWQYKSLLCARNAGGSGHQPVAPSRIRVTLVTPGVVAALQPRTTVPALPLPVPMDVDHAHACNLPHCGCFRCGDSNHFARDCPAPANIRSTDILDEVIHQLGDDILEELVARLTMTEVRANEPIPEGFPFRDK